MHLEIRRVDWPFASVFCIAYEVRTHAQTVVAELHDNVFIGRGEALGVSYHGETADSVMAQLQALQSSIAKGISRPELQSMLPLGGARNALDCALWDLEAKRLGRRAWELAGIASVKPLTTAYTLGADAPRAMAQAAAVAHRYCLLKLKLTGQADVECVTAVRKARPDADIIVDANQAWGERQLIELAPLLADLGVLLIEQPLPAGNDAALENFESPVPLCADESCQDTVSLPSLVGKYQYANIKLDKTGGLTEALSLARAARALNLKLMVGCMGGSSLSMAPAFIVGQLGDFIDLDGPLLSSADVPDGIRYEGNTMHAPAASLWG